MKRTIIVLYLSVILLSCQQSKTKDNLPNSVFETLKDNQLEQKKKELEKYYNFEKINRIVYNSTINYNDYKNILTSKRRFPKKYKSIIFFDDLVFNGSDIEKDFMMSVNISDDEILKKNKRKMNEIRKPIINAIFYTTWFIKGDFENLSKIIGNYSLVGSGYYMNAQKHQSTLIRTKEFF